LDPVIVAQPVSAASTAMVSKLFIVIPGNIV
jgi:hypothetical protein